MKVLVLSLAMAAGVAGMGQAPMENHAAKVKIPSTTLTLTANGKSITLSPADLAAMPQRTVTARNGHNNAEETYTGVGMSDLLTKYGYTLDDGGAKRVYHSYVKVEGTDKYFVLYSASELEPTLHTGDSIIALTLNGQPLTEDGKFKFVVQGEKKPARWVTNVNAITIVTVE